jgi:arsenate reductase-like glutaredoxin family protein
MAPKRATFYTISNDSTCLETKKFIEDAGVLLTIRNLDEKPLSIRELRNLIGHIDPKHFLNTASPEYAKMSVDEKLNNRDELFVMISENYNLLRRPIVSTARLTTIGCDKKKLAEMLQISYGNGQGTDDSKGNLKNSKYVTRRTTTRSSETKPVTTTVTPVVTPSERTSK